MGQELSGIHHVTAIAGDPQENLDFYVGVLGMRLVKRSVNQDAVGTYHFFYADAEGHPGTDLTFFPWPDGEPARMGAGLGSEIGLAVPPGSLGYWSERLARYGARLGEPEVRRGEWALPVTDPHGLALSLVATGDAREFAPWDGSSVPSEHQVRGLHAVRVVERALTPTASFLTEVLGFRPLGSEGGWYRYALASGSSGTLIEVREAPTGPRGAWGTGSMHHVAWRVAGDEGQASVRHRIAAAGRRPTEVIDRFWFRSVYFLEPGGVLFEVATDGPGFAVDEDPRTLGEHLVLPPWLEPYRETIEAELPPVTVPGAVVQGTETGAR